MSMLRQPPHAARGGWTTAQCVMAARIWQRDMVDVFGDDDGSDVWAAARKRAIASSCAPSSMAPMSRAPRRSARRRWNGRPRICTRRRLPRGAPPASWRRRRSIFSPGLPAPGPERPRRAPARRVSEINFFSSEINVAISNWPYKSAAAPRVPRGRANTSAAPGVLNYFRALCIINATGH